MESESGISRRGFLAAAGGVSAALAGCAATSMQADAEQPGGPLVIAKQGSFFVGGRRIYAEINDGAAPGGPRVYSNAPAIFGPGHIILDQAYVQYQIPARKTSPYPIVLTHGGGHHGAFYEATPDGRDGYYTYFARRGYAVYNLDDVNRGRSGYDVQDINAVKLGLKPASAIPSMNKYSQERAWTAFGIGPEPGVAFAGSQFPAEAMDQYSAQLVPAWRERAVEDPKNTAAFVALFDRVGPAILLTWSQSGLYGWMTAMQRPNLVKGIIALEPSTLPATVAPGELANLAKVPVVIVAAEHSINPVAYYQAIVDKLKAAGGRAEVVHLPGLGILGNSHVMAIEKNNLQIAELALARLVKLMQ